MLIYVLFVIQVLKINIKNYLWFYYIKKVFTFVLNIVYFYIGNFFKFLKKLKIKK